MYKNYGDVNFFEYGIYVKELGNNEFSILKCMPSDDEMYGFGELVVSIDDGWIDKDAVMSYAGMENFDSIMFAIACTDYYAWENFGSFKRLTKKEVEENLKKYNI